MKKLLLSLCTAVIILAPFTSRGLAVSNFNRVIRSAISIAFEANSLEQKKLTNIENAYPDWSPDGTRLVFQSNRTGSSQIYVMNSDGSNVLRLTTHSANDAGPHFSPDGSKITFDSDRDGNSEVYIMNSDGTGQTRLTTNPMDDGHPNWSLDGSRIIFDSSRDTPNPKADWWDQYHDLYSMKVDGTDLRKITNCQTVCTYGSWSPDGKRIAYRKVINTPGFYDDKNLTLSTTNSEVFIANSDGSNELNLSKSAAYDAWPSWSPDGSKILFGSNRAAVTQVYVVNVDGSHLTRLIDERETDEDTRARWSRDASKIVFTRMRKGTMDIYVLEVGKSR